MSRTSWTCFPVLLRNDWLNNIVINCLLGWRFRRTAYKDTELTHLYCFGYVQYVIPQKEKNQEAVRKIWISKRREQLSKQENLSRAETKRRINFKQPRIAIGWQNEVSLTNELQVVWHFESDISLCFITIPWIWVSPGSVSKC